MNAMERAAVRLRRGEIEFDEALAALQREWSGSQQLALELARAARGEQVERMLDATRGMAASYVVARTLLSRGMCDAVLSREWPTGRLIDWCGELVARGAFEPALLAKLAAQLELEIDTDAKLDELEVLGLKRTLDRLEPALQAKVLDWLEPRVAEGNESGRYEELDYPYGQVDPNVEITLCFLRASDPDKAEAYLQERAKWPQMMHWEELLDLVRICELMPDGRRRRWWERFRAWARTGDARGSVPRAESLETEWLLRAATPWQSHESELLARIAHAEASTVQMVLDVDGSRAVRDAARSRAVDLFERHVRDLTEGRDDHYQLIGAVRCAAEALDGVADELTDDERTRVAAAATRWAAWFAGYDVGDWLPHRYTAIALAGSWLPEIDVAAQRLRRQVEAGDDDLLTYQGAERLLYAWAG